MFTIGRRIFTREQCQGPNALIFITTQLVWLHGLHRESSELGIDRFRTQCTISAIWIQLKDKEF